MDRNGYFGGAALPSADASPVSGDPQFVDSARHDYRLRSSVANPNPMVNSGAATGIGTDFAGNARTLPPDIGAFEWIGP